MNIILYIIALILVVAAVLSASGCAEKTQTTGNEIQGALEQVTPTAMAKLDSNSSKVVDVVCKMKVEKSVIDTSVYNGKTYYFCSPYCKQEFDKNPEKYINF